MVSVPNNHHHFAHDVFPCCKSAKEGLLSRYSWRQRCGLGDVWGKSATHDPGLYVHRKEHQAGVCCIQSHPCQEHVICTGSYDEHARLWDCRSMAKPLLTAKVSGLCSFATVVPGPHSGRQRAGSGEAQAWSELALHQAAQLQELQSIDKQMQTLGKGGVGPNAGSMPAWMLPELLAETCGILCDALGWLHAAGHWRRSMAVEVAPASSDIVAGSMHAGRL